MNINRPCSEAHSSSFDSPTFTKQIRDTLPSRSRSTCIGPEVATCISCCRSARVDQSDPTTGRPPGLGELALTRVYSAPRTVSDGLNPSASRALRVAAATHPPPFRRHPWRRLAESLKPGPGTKGDLSGGGASAAQPRVPRTVEPRVLPARLDLPPLRRWSPRVCREDEPAGFDFRALNLPPHGSVRLRLGVDGNVCVLGSTGENSFVARNGRLVRRVKNRGRFVEEQCEIRAENRESSHETP